MGDVAHGGTGPAEVTQPQATESLRFTLRGVTGLSFRLRLRNGSRLFLTHHVGHITFNKTAKEMRMPEVPDTNELITPPNSLEGITRARASHTGARIEAPRCPRQPSSHESADLLSSVGRSSPRECWRRPNPGVVVRPQGREDCWDLRLNRAIGWLRSLRHGRGPWSAWAARNLARTAPEERTGSERRR